MTNIEVFNTEAERISKLADKFDICTASVVDMMFEALEENDINIEEYLA